MASATIPGIAASPLSAGPAIGQYTGIRALGGGKKHDAPPPNMPQSLAPFAGGGSYTEGTISNFLSYAKQQRKLVDEGKMSQQEYVGKLAPVINDLSAFTTQMMGSGSSAAKAAGAAGANELFDKVLPEFQMYQTAHQLLGRDMTPEEEAQFGSTFKGPNGLDTGKQALASYHQQLMADPNNPLSPLNPNNKNNTLSQFNPQVQDMFKNTLGRDASQEELSHFSSLIGSGQADALTIQNALKQMPEYTNKQDTAFRGSLANELQGYDVNFFNKAKQDVLGGAMQNTGGIVSSSSALDSALTNLMGNIAQNRSQYLAGLSAQQYGGNKDLAVQNYQNQAGQQQGVWGQNYGNAMNMQNALTQRGWQSQDYQRQMSDYLNFMNQNRGRQGSNPLYGAIGGTLGAIGGAFAGGPAGAGAGYQVGSGLGNAYGYLNR